MYTRYLQLHQVQQFFHHLCQGFQVLSDQLSPSGPRFQAPSWLYSARCQMLLLQKSPTPQLVESTFKVQLIGWCIFYPNAQTLLKLEDNCNVKGVDGE